MSQLSDRDIVRSMDAGHLLVKPFDVSLVQPASLDVRISPDFLEYTADGEVQPVHASGVYRLPPSIDVAYVLASTVEVVGLSSELAARVEGKSTWGRRGVIVQTAGFIDPGFLGTITLELVNYADRYVDIPIGTAIAQLSFHRLTSPAQRPYGSPGLGSHYQGQQGPTSALG